MGRSVGVLVGVSVAAGVALGIRVRVMVGEGVAGVTDGVRVRVAAGGKGAVVGAAQPANKNINAIRLVKNLVFITVVPECIKRLGCV